MNSRRKSLSQKKFGIYRASQIALSVFKKTNKQTNQKKTKQNKKTDNYDKYF